MTCPNFCNIRSQKRTKSSLGYQYVFPHATGCHRTVTELFPSPTATRPSSRLSVMSGGRDTSLSPNGLPGIHDSTPLLSLLLAVFEVEPHLHKASDYRCRDGISYILTRSLRPEYSKLTVRIRPTPIIVGDERTDTYSYSLLGTKPPSHLSQLSIQPRSYLLPKEEK